MQVFYQVLLLSWQKLVLDDKNATLLITDEWNIPHRYCCNSISWPGGQQFSVPRTVTTRQNSVMLFQFTNQNKFLYVILFNNRLFPILTISAPLNFNTYKAQVKIMVLWPFLYRCHANRVTGLPREINQHEKLNAHQMYLSLELLEVCGQICDQLQHGDKKQGLCM